MPQCFNLSLKAKEGEIKSFFLYKIVEKLIFLFLKNFKFEFKCAQMHLIDLL